MSRDEWEENSRPFHYEPPEKEPEFWDEDEITELCDRVITNGTMGWECQKCTSPMSSLRKARRHVERQHLGQLFEEVDARAE